MQRLVTAILLVVVGLSALSLASCSLLDTPTAQANSAIDDASGHFAAYRASVQKGAGLSEQLKKLDTSPEGAEQGLEITARIEAIDTQDSELDQAAQRVGRLQKLDVDAGLRSTLSSRLRRSTPNGWSSPRIAACAPR